MRFSLSLVLFSAVSFLGFQSTAGAQDIVVPAGTLLHCTLNEPALSSATVSVGDPVVCYLRSLQEFGHVVFPRGSYLGGHVEAAKEPGHFYGKGSLRLVFDRVGLPSTDLPVPSKVVGVRGYKTDRQGDIIGHGHATRDVIEWMIPPLWPWKVLTLPARGPRPVLKGEEPITVRLMDDIVVPRSLVAAALPDWRPSVDRLHSRNSSNAMDQAQPASSSQSQSFASPGSTFTRISYAPPSSPAMEEQASPATLRESQPAAIVAAEEPAVQPVRLTLIALKTDRVYSVASYRVNGGSLSYVLPDGSKGSVDETDVDWRRTSQLNASPNIMSVARDDRPPY